MYTIRWNPQRLQEVLKIACTVLAYWVISILLVFANKFLVGDHNSASDVSLYVAWIQCAVVALLSVMIRMVQCLRGGDWSKMAIKREHIFSKPVFLNSVTFVSMLSFNNLCLRHVGVPFYQVARSLTLVFTAVLSMIMLGKAMSTSVSLCCLTVVGGFILGIDQEQFIGSLSIAGVVFGVTSSLFVALNGIFTKRALEVVDDDPVRLTYFISVNAVILFLPVVAATSQLGEVMSNPTYRTNYFWAFLGVTGVLGYLISWVSARQISLTSPVTHNISGNTKAVLQTILAVLFYHVSKPPLWWLSNGLVVGGAMAYAIIRIKEELTNRVHSPADMESATNTMLHGVAMPLLDAGQLRLATTPDKLSNNNISQNQISEV